MIEMIYMMPVVLMMWAMIIFALFYYHDKNIVAGAAYETAVVGSEYVRVEKEVDISRLEYYFQNRVKDKMLFFSYANVEVEVDEEVKVTGSAQGKGMKFVIEEWAAITEPEKKLRKIEQIKDGLEEVSE